MLIEGRDCMGNRRRERVKQNRKTCDPDPKLPSFEECTHRKYYSRVSIAISGGTLFPVDVTGFSDCAGVRGGAAGCSLEIKPFSYVIQYKTARRKSGMMSDFV